MKEQVFWNWFINHKHLFENVLIDLRQTNQEKINETMDLFEKSLHEYDNNIWFRMGGSNPFELIITAEGNRDAFDSILRLVNSSPQIDNWKIIAFIQPQDISNFQYRKDDYELNVNDIFFSYSENISGKNGYYMETMFYVRDEKHIDNDGFKSSIIRIAETAIGEYDFARIIGFINVVKSSDVYQKHLSGLIPINKFSETVNEIKAKIE